MAEVRPYVSKRRKKDETLKPDVIPVTEESPLQGLTSKNAKGDLCHQAEVAPKVIAGKGRCNNLPKVRSAIFKSHSNAVNCVRWNHDVSSSTLLSASMDSKILLFRWNGRATQLQRSISSHIGAVKDARWSNDNKSILSGSYDKHARITDAESGQQVFCHKFKDFVTSVLYHPSIPDVFLSGTSSNGIYAVDSKSGKEIHHYKSFFGQVQDLLFHPDEKRFFSAAEILKRNSMDKAIIGWDFESTAIISNQISQEAFACSCLRLHPVDPVFLAQYGTGYISIFSTTSPYKLNKYKRFEGHQTAGFNIGFSISPDGCCVGSGDREGKIHIYDYSSSRELKTLPGHGSACMDVAYHSVLSNVMASCSWDGEIAFWE